MACIRGGCHERSAARPSAILLFDRVRYRGGDRDRDPAYLTKVFWPACVALQIGDCADDVRQAIANKIIDLAKTGERNPDLLCEGALKEIRQPHM
jgi:hypothetical protein